MKQGISKKKSRHFTLKMVKAGVAGGFLFKKQLDFAALAKENFCDVLGTEVAPHDCLFVFFYLC